MRKHLASLVVGVGVAAPVIALSTPSVAAGTQEPATAKTIAETAASDPQFSTLVSLVKRAGLADELSGDAKLTVLAPTNAAFRKVPAAKLRSLRRNRSALRRVLLYHVIDGDVKAEQIVQRRALRTLAGRTVRVRVRDDTVYLNRRARVVKADVAASNGTIHVIDRVLMPPAR